MIFNHDISFLIILLLFSDCYLKNINFILKYFKDNSLLLIRYILLIKK